MTKNDSVRTVDDKNIVNDPKILYAELREFILEMVSDDPKLLAYATEIVDSYQCHGFVVNLCVEFKRPNMLLDILRPVIVRSIASLYEQGFSAEYAAEHGFTGFILCLEPANARISHRSLDDVFSRGPK